MGPGAAAAMVSGRFDAASRSAPERQLARAAAAGASPSERRCGWRRAGASAFQSMGDVSSLGELCQNGSELIAPHRSGVIRLLALGALSRPRLRNWTTVFTMGLMELDKSVRCRC